MTEQTETEAILSDPDTMAAIAEAEAEIRYTRAQLRQVLFGRRRTNPAYVVHSGRTTENRSTRTERRKHAKGYKAQQRIRRYGRP